MTSKDQLDACLAAKSVAAEERSICTTYAEMLARGETLSRQQLRFIEKLYGEVLRQEPR
jgi:phage FluMu protein gp41